MDLIFYDICGGRKTCAENVLKLTLLGDRSLFPPLLADSRLQGVLDRLVATKLSVSGSNPGTLVRRHSPSGVNVPNEPSGVRSLSRSTAIARLLFPKNWRRNADASHEVSAWNRVAQDWGGS